MKTYHSISLAVTCIVLSVLLGTITLDARGLRPPPPPFSGGNSGSWIPRGSLFDPEHPLGPDFFIPPGTDFGGGIPTEWNPDSPNGRKGPDIGPGCPGECQRASLTGPCRELCECYSKTSDNAPSDPSLWPDEGITIEGICQPTGAGDNLGGCVNPYWNCSYVLQKPTGPTQ